MNLYKTRKPIDISGARLLAVDDERALCDMVARWLSKEGIACDRAYCVDDAVSLMQQTHYDLVISDITMPGKSGIRVAGPMHDVGKIGIPDEILRKPGKLTPEEFGIIKQHPQIGAQILADSTIPLLHMAQEIALYHHEKWDGSGYPHGLKKEAIPEAAQIVAIVDVYDALSNDRVYRDALPEEKVLSILEEGKGSHFNPHIFVSFLEVLPELRKILKEHGDMAG